MNLMSIKNTYNCFEGFHNIEIFFKSVQEIITNEKLHSSMSNESKKKFNKFFSIDSCVKQYLDLM